MTKPKPKGYLKMLIATHLRAEDRRTLELMMGPLDLDDIPSDEELAKLPATVEEFADRYLERKAASRTRHARHNETRPQNIPKWLRPACGAKTRAGGRCKASPVWDKENNRPKNGRCRLHGGLSTGQKTPEGRAKSLANLKQYRDRDKDKG